MTPGGRRLLRHAPLALLLLAGLLLRWQVAWEFHAPAGDGLGFHRIAHELREHHRFAFGADQPLDFTREPIWPFVVAAVDTGHGNDIEHVLVWATRLNALFDLLTALFVFLIARELGLRRWAWLACALVVLCPLLILHCCYLLRESACTVALTASVWMAVRSLVRRDGRWLIAASGMFGVALMVRFDLLPGALAYVVPWVRLPGWRNKLRVAALSIAACAAALAPWSIRNLIHFGDPHIAGGYWADVNGVQLPTGERWWVRTWVDRIRFDGTGAAWLNMRLVFHQPVGERDVPRQATDSLEERREVMALFARYNKEYVSPAVDAGFRDLAARRLRAHPLRVAVWLPIRRALLWYWSFPPPEELPLRSRTLHQPEWRDLFEWISHAFALLGALGIVLLVLDGRGAFAALALLTLAVRALTMSIAGPDGGYQRYLTPVYPVLLVAVTCAVASIAGRVTAWRRRATTGGAPSPESSASV